MHLPVPGTQLATDQKCLLLGMGRFSCSRSSELRTAVQFLRLMALMDAFPCLARTAYELLVSNCNGFVGEIAMHGRSPRAVGPSARLRGRTGSVNFPLVCCSLRSL